MPPKSSKKSSTVPNSPPKPRRSGRKRARSSLDTTVAPPNKKLAKGDEAEGEGEGDEGGPIDVKKDKSKGIKYANCNILQFTAKIVWLIEKQQ
jgi:hypothetical protein